MPSYNSKSQKRSKNSKNSKSGGRRRNSTMRKLRRARKSRKVMRGGAFINNWEEIDAKLKANSEIKMKLIIAFDLLENATSKEIFDAVSRYYKGTNINTTEVINRNGPIKNDPDLIAFFSRFQ